MCCFIPAGVCAPAAVGEHRVLADTVGINVFKMRYVNVILGGCLAGLAGAFLTLEAVGSFEAQHDERTWLHRPGLHDLWQVDAAWLLGSRTVLRPFHCSCHPDLVYVWRDGEHPPPGVGYLALPVHHPRPGRHG